MSRRCTGWSALMEIQSSRSAARTGPDGEPVLLLDQDRTRWDRLLINRGLAALARAEELGGAHGPYALQAAIAACHARAFRPEDTDWARIAELYGELAAVQPSPVVELNRAVAVSMAFGPQAGLDLVDQLAGEPALRGYHLLPSVRGDLLMKLGRPDEARAEFERAAAADPERARARAAGPAGREARAAGQAGADGGPTAGPSQGGVQRPLEVLVEGECLRRDERQRVAVDRGADPGRAVHPEVRVAQSRPGPAPGPAHPRMSWVSSSSP